MNPGIYFSFFENLAPQSLESVCPQGITKVCKFLYMDTFFHLLGVLKGSVYVYSHLNICKYLYTPEI